MDGSMQVGEQDAKLSDRLVDLQNSRLNALGTNFKTNDDTLSLDEKNNTTILEVYI